MTDVPNRETFASMYSGKAPWDIDKAQPTLVEVADQVQGSVLDAGCGTGENAIFFAKRGHAVLGIDYLEFPIQAAKRKAQERGVAAEFLCKDALTLTTFDRKFDSVIDSGLFHCFSDEDQKQYVAGLAHVTRAGGRLYLMCFSDAEPGTMGPRRISESTLRSAFATGWTIEVLRPVQLEVIPDLKEFSFSAGGPKAWLAVVKRNP